jgi:hypothetical protein
LRFTRDKRGYENTYVVHNPRRRKRSRILYWFRTPPGVRVGRAALDEEAIRLIEEHHPQIRFNWTQILNGEEELVPAEPPRRTEPADTPEPAPAPAIESGPATIPPVLVEDPASPAHARLGSEGLARLRARYADVSATIGRRIADEQRRQQLLDLAGRLDPDSWVTAEDVQRGLDEYESVLASLREVAGRRRRRKRSRSAAAAAPGKPADESVSSDEAPGFDDGGSEDSEPD